MAIIIFFLGMIISRIGYILFWVAAFKESLLWGLLCLFAGPACLIFLFIYWSEAWKPLCIQLAGILVLAMGLAMMPDFSAGDINTKGIFTNDISARDIISRVINTKDISTKDIPQAASSYAVLLIHYDLAAKIISYTPESVHVGDAVTFTYSVINKGKYQVPKGSYMVKFYVNDKLISSFGLTKALSAGKSISYTKDKGHFVAERPEEYTYKLEIIPKDGVVDTYPANNIVTGTITVQHTAVREGKSDLELKTLI